MIRRLMISLAACLTPLLAAPEKRVIDGITYYLLRTSPETLRVVWKDAAGQPLRTFSAAHAFLTSRGDRVDTLMNGGIFEPGGIPSGLLVQDGRELHPINRREGKGNFFLEPNGVFLIHDKGAMVIDSSEYPPNGMKVAFAVQSGPLLLRDGKIHPQFRAGSPNRLHRNGIGVAKDGTVVLAISDPDSPKLPNFHELAALFVTLGCQDALFLDGVISRMHSGDGSAKESGSFGSFIAVVKAPVVK